MAGAAVVVGVGLSVWRDRPGPDLTRVVEVVGESHGFAALDADDVAADAGSRMGGASRAQEPVRDGQRVRVLAGGHVHIEAADPLLFGNRVDLNHSDAQALMALDGMGASRARAVMAARPFTRPSDLVRARGFGARTAAQLVPLVQTVDPPPPPEPEPVADALASDGGPTPGDGSAAETDATTTEDVGPKPEEAEATPKPTPDTAGEPPKP